MRKTVDMPEIPLPTGGGGWENWIIATFASIIATMVTTIVTMVRFIQGQYQKTIEELKGRVEAIELENTTLHAEATACREDRAIFKGRIEALELSVKAGNN
jgi:formiminotetrahydrofolate cyclodeaminase